jgi:hypothetical protein
MGGAIELLDPFFQNAIDRATSGSVFWGGSEIVESIDWSMGWCAATPFLGRSWLILTRSASEGSGGFLLAGASG